MKLILVVLSLLPANSQRKSAFGFYNANAQTVDNIPFLALCHSTMPESRVLLFHIDFYQKD